jgi:hypothetical protein
MMRTLPNNTWKTAAPPTISVAVHNPRPRVTHASQMAGRK